MSSTPLRLFLLAHPQSETAGLLATELMRRFVDPPGRGGLRISVRLTPHNTNGLPPDWQQHLATPIEEAEHALVIVLSDALMTHAGFGSTAAQWRTFVSETRQQLSQTPNRHLLLGVALGDASLSLDAQNNQVRIPAPPDDGAQAANFPAWLTEAADTAALHIAIHAFALLQPAARQAHDNQQHPFLLFLSHAKKDLASIGTDNESSDPVRQLRRSIQDLPVKDWFDARDIRGGRKFAEEIAAGIRNCSVVLTFLTDHYSTRPWCLEEVVQVKHREPRGPLVVIDALENGETRSFPWLGNAPVVVWKPTQPLATARTILWQAAREALRFQLNTEQLRKAAAQLPQPELADLLPCSPEPIDLARLPPHRDRRRCILYPDPPVILPELRLLRALQDADYCTPLGLLARRASTLRGKSIVVSVSESADLTKLGLCPLHEQDFTDEIHLSLLLAGLRIIYGGRLEAPAQANGRNFTLRLLDLARGYAELALNLETEIQPVHNIPPWPLVLSCRPPFLSPQVLSLLNDVATLESGPVPDPAEIPDTDDDGQPLFPPDKALRDLPDTPLRRLAWTRGLSLMRRKTTIDSAARIVMGGKLVGAAGVYPGVLEEAWWSIRLGRPLFLLGALGGAGQAVIDLLEGRPRPDLVRLLSPEHNPQIRQTLQAAVRRGITVGPWTPTSASNGLTGTLADPLSILHDLQTAGHRGPAAALNNGLTDAENRSLFAADEPDAVVQLLLTGLERLSPR
jgi:hypothetical protein